MKVQETNNGFTLIPENDNDTVMLADVALQRMFTIFEDGVLKFYLQSKSPQPDVVVEALEGK